MNAPPKGVKAPGEAPAPGLMGRSVGAIARRLPRTSAIVRQTFGRTLRDGYIHAGNIAYLSLVTLLPLIILITAVTAGFGQTDAGQYAIDGMLRALPANVADLFEPVIAEVLDARTGNLLWIGGLVALWTVTSFIETLRDILHRSYQVPFTRHFLEYRLMSVGGTIVAMLLVIIAFIAQFVLVVAVKSVTHLFSNPLAIPAWLDISRLLTPVVIFLALWALLKLLTPSAFRKSAAWPGALITTFAWVVGLLLLGPLFSGFGHMGLTYGALSGVMLALLFFYAVGFALVLGAEFNAALAMGGSCP
ncbi:MAG: YihY/virulence factor BrkB family protein [Sandaracinobacteroides sp.]